MNRKFNLPFDYIFCTYYGFCWLLFPFGSGKWLALQRSTKKLRPCAYDERDKPMFRTWDLVIPKDVENMTSQRDKHGNTGRGLKQLIKSLFGDDWYRASK